MYSEPHSEYKWQLPLSRITRLLTYCWVRTEALPNAGCRYMSSTPHDKGSYLLETAML